MNSKKFIKLLPRKTYELRPDQDYYIANYKSYFVPNSEFLKKSQKEPSQEVNQGVSQKPQQTQSEEFLARDQQKDDKVQIIATPQKESVIPLQTDENLQQSRKDFASYLSEQKEKNFEPTLILNDLNLSFSPTLELQDREAEEQVEKQIQKSEEQNKNFNFLEVLNRKKQNHLTRRSQEEPAFEQPKTLQGGNIKKNFIKNGTQLLKQTQDNLKFGVNSDSIHATDFKQESSEIRPFVTESAQLLFQSKPWDEEIRQFSSDHHIEPLKQEINQLKTEDQFLKQDLNKIKLDSNQSKTEIEGIQQEKSDHLHQIINEKQEEDRELISSNQDQVEGKYQQQKKSDLQVTEVQNSSGKQLGHLKIFQNKTMQILPPLNEDQGGRKLLDKKHINIITENTILDEDFDNIPTQNQENNLQQESQKSQDPNNQNSFSFSKKINLQEKNLKWQEMTNFDDLFEKEGEQSKKIINSGQKGRSGPKGLKRVNTMISNNSNANEKQKQTESEAESLSNFEEKTFSPIPKKQAFREENHESLEEAEMLQQKKSIRINFPDQRALQKQGSNIQKNEQIEQKQEFPRIEQDTKKNDNKAEQLKGKQENRPSKILNVQKNQEQTSIRDISQKKSEQIQKDQKWTKVGFSGFEKNSKIKDQLNALNLELEELYDFDLLIVKELKRTVKLLVAINLNVPIVNSLWLEVSVKKRQIFQNYQDYQPPENKDFTDKFQTTFSNLVENRKKLKEPVFSTIVAYISPHAAPSFEELKYIFEAGKGYVIEDLKTALSQINSQVVFVMNEKEKEKIKRIKQKRGKVVSNEFILSSSLFSALKIEENVLKS